MTPADLRRLILQLDPGGPIHRQLEADLRGGRPPKAWYRDQREHLLGWLGEYAGPGAYGRAAGDRSAAYFWNHFQCAAGLAWLAEAVRVPADVIMSACEAARSSGPNLAAQCGAFRRVIPWAVVEARLRQVSVPVAQRAPALMRRRWKMELPAGANDNAAYPGR